MMCDQTLKPKWEPTYKIWLRALSWGIVLAAAFVAVCYLFGGFQ